MMQFVFDLTALAGWTRAVVGVIRIERELGLRAAALYPEDTLVFANLDPETGRIMALPRTAAADILEGRLRIADRRECQRTRERTLLRRIQRKTRKLLRRSASIFPSNGVFGRAEFESVMRTMFKDGDHFDVPGPRVSSLRRLGAIPLTVQPGSTLVSTGLGTTEWLTQVRILKQTTGVRYVAYCHDLIPVTFPHFVPSDHLPRREDYFADLFWTADVVLLNSEAVRRDVASYCAAHGVTVPALAVCPPGSNLSAAPERPCCDLVPERFVLYVAAIEPRKNHRFLYDLWRQLQLERAIPEDFKLVLVGEPYSDVMETVNLLRRDPLICRSVVMLNGVSDGELAWLYRNARIFVHPSFAEGYAMPVAEALRCGTTGICSDDPAMREIFGYCIPAISVARRDEWKSLIALLCTDDAALRAARERAALYAPRSWDDCAHEVFASVQSSAGPRG